MAGAQPDLLWTRQASVPEVERLCAELAAAGNPETVQHDDQHDGNVFVGNGGYLTFDWRDNCVRDAYLVPFDAYGSRAELLNAFATAYRLETIGRGLSWYRAVRAHPGIPPEQSDSVPYGLKQFLNNAPIGTWQ
jgi:hypothetical protein